MDDDGRYKRGPLSRYDRGATTVYALPSDPRFSFCLYVPSTFDPAHSELIVVVHGSYRHFTVHRDQFAGFSEQNNCVVLAPLFPVGVLGDGNDDGFKYLTERGIRYDTVLDAMIGEVRNRWGLQTDTFGLVGFSGGGQFAHRYLILHPHRLWAASIGAPGSVTLLDPDREWWIGIADIEARFGTPVDFARLRGIPVQLIIGELDTDRAEITYQPGSRYWQDGANDAGQDRVERLKALRASFAAAGIPATFSQLPGVGHEAEPVFAASLVFLTEHLQHHRARTSTFAAPFLQPAK